MKSLFLAILFTSLLISCESAQETQNKSTGIIGTWKLTETRLSNGGNNPSWLTPNVSYTYTFNADGSFTSTQFSKCTKGQYTTNDAVIEYDYDCVNFSTGHENLEGKLTDRFSLENGYLILRPTYCIEECAYKFKKIK